MWISNCIWGEGILRPFLVGMYPLCLPYIDSSDGYIKMRIDASSLNVFFIVSIFFFLLWSSWNWNRRIKRWWWVAPIQRLTLLKNVIFEIQFKNFFMSWKCHFLFLRYSIFYNRNYSANLESCDFMMNISISGRTHS